MSGYDKAKASQPRDPENGTMGPKSGLANAKAIVQSGAGNGWKTAKSDVKNGRKPG